MITSYFNKIRYFVEKSSIVVSEGITYDWIDSDRGKIHGRIDFIDGSILYFPEYVIITDKVKKPKYRFQWQKQSGKLIVRWDNAHPQEIASFPHHKHAGRDSIKESKEMNLDGVIDEIQDAILAIK